jgi:hypothetical protein
MNVEEDSETKEEKRRILKKKYGMNMYSKNKHCENSNRNTKETREH